jgi:multidrug resistance efflux pump
LTSDSASAAEVDSAASAAEAAGAAVDAAAARLQLLEQGERSELKREAQAALAAAEAELEEARALLAMTVLKAPRAGVIVRRLMDPGEAVVTTPPSIVLTIADLDHLQVRAEVDEIDVGRVAVGQVGWATAEAFAGQRFPGKVVRLTGELGRKTVRMGAWTIRAPASTPACSR